MNMCYMFRTLLFGRGHKWLLKQVLSIKLKNNNSYESVIWTYNLEQLENI